MDKKRKKNEVHGQIRRPRLEDFQIPDRTFSDYYCKICNSHMNSGEMWDSHTQGKRHHKKVKEYISTLPDKPFHEKSARIPLATPVIERRLMDISDPIVGLKYISEINKSDLLLGPIYKCFLCHACLPNGDFLIDHLYSSKHILAYGQLVDPDEHRSMVGFGKNALESFAAEWAARLERKYGRGRMNVEFEKQGKGSESFMAVPETKYHVRSDYSPKRHRAQYHSRDDRSSRRRRLSELSEFSDDFSDSSSGNHRSYRERSPSYKVSKSFDLSRSRDERDRLRSVRQVDELQRLLLAKARRAREKQLEKKRFTDDFSDSSSGNHRSCRDKSLDLSKSRDEMNHLRSVHQIEELQRKLLAKARRAREKQLEEKRKSSVSRQECFLKEKLPCPKDNACPDKVYAAVNSSTNDVKSPTKIFVNQDFLKAIRNSPSALTIKLLEKMGPYVVTSDEECHRLNKIAMAIERSCMDYKYMSLNPEQKRKILKLLEKKPEFLMPLIQRCRDE